MILVTASDAKYFDLMKDLIVSVQTFRPATIEVGVIDLGLTDGQRQWLTQRRVQLRPPYSGFDLTSLKHKITYEIGFLARPFINDIFPGHDVYIWADADVWLQSWDGIHSLVAGALAQGGAVVREDEPAYRFVPRYHAWKVKHFCLGVGARNGLALSFRPHINSGLLAIRADAPHWTSWQRHYQRAIERTGHYLYDQISLNAAIYLDRLPTAFVASTCNWIADLGAPIWDTKSGLLRAPTPPYPAIGNLHLAGSSGKARDYELKCSDGTVKRISLRYRSVLSLSEENHLVH